MAKTAMHLADEVLPAALLRGVGRSSSRLGIVPPAFGSRVERMLGRMGHGPVGWPALVLAASLSVGCNMRRAYTDWVAREPEAVRFGTPEPRLPLALATPIRVGDVRAGAGLSKVAGDISGMPDPIPVPFSAGTPPVAVLRADLERMLSPPDTATPALRLDATFVHAYVQRTYHAWKASEMQGKVLLDVTLVEPGTERTLASLHIVGEHVVRPAYITSAAVEDALNAAYSEALSSLGAALVSAAAARATR